MGRAVLSREYRWLILAGVLIALILGGATTVYPSIVFMIFFGIGIVVATWFLPECVLALVLVLTLTGGEFGYLASAGYRLSVIAGAASIIFIFGARTALPGAKRLLLPLLLIAVMALRYLLEDDLGSVTTVARLAAVVFLTYFSLYKQRNIVSAVTVAAIIFVALTLVLGEFNDAGIRYSGISGNPNRMVYALSILLPFLLASLFRPTYKFGKVFICLSIIMAVIFLYMSMSSQAIVVLIMLIVGVIWASLSSRSPILKYTVVTVSALGAIAFYFYVLPSVQISEDLSTLSGRTGLHEVAWSEFANNPSYGTGERYVSADSVVDRSAHSSVLGLLAYGGLIAGIPWLLILVRMLRTGVQQLNSRDLLGLTPLALIILQSVQSVEFIAPTWFIIAFFSFQAFSRNNREGLIFEYDIDAAPSGRKRQIID